MNIALWVVKGLLAFVFLAAGIPKLTWSKEKLAAKMGDQEDQSLTQTRLIGLAEVLGALGLILPSLTGILPWLSSLAAIGLGLVMVGASFVNFRHKKYPMLAFTLLLLVLTITVAVGPSSVKPL